MRMITLACAAAAAASQSYTVDVISQPDQPVLSYLAGTTAWPQSFNPSWVTASPGTAGVEGLLVRSQNCSDAKPGECVACNVPNGHPIGPGKPFVGSVITFAARRPDGSFEAPYLVFAPDAASPVDETYGTEDPRLAYDAATGNYHLFYTAYGKKCPLLAHAVTRNPTAPLGSPASNWTRLGAVNGACGSKSGALLIRPAPPHYLIWGAGVIALAVSEDLVNFTTVNSSFITKRPGSFDNQLVEAGPPPLPLSDGNLVFFHNSDNSTGKPGDFGAYNPGWVVLDGADPSRILARSAMPLLSPVFDWEQGVAPALCNVHDVTFLEAATPVAGQADTFDVYFGGADTVVGTARVRVNVPGRAA